MRFEILKVEDKSPEWKVVTAKEGIENGRTFTDVSINEKDRAGVVAWPTFSQISVGDTLEADYWRSTQNKQYLFAPKPKAPTGGSGGGMRGVAAAQERKAVAIEKTMDRKEAGILVAAAMRDCTVITLAALKDQPFPTDEDFKREFKNFKDWYIKEWHDTEKGLDVPFKG